MPGYVFFENDSEPNWYEICKCQYVYYPLGNANSSRNLKNRDLDFIEWLKGNNGKIGISSAKKAGNRIEFINGPLLELGKYIVKLNKKQKCAGIRIAGDNIKEIIWLSYELEPASTQPSHKPK